MRVEYFRRVTPLACRATVQVAHAPPSLARCWRRGADVRVISCVITSPPHLRQSCVCADCSSSRLRSVVVYVCCVYTRGVHVEAGAGLLVCGVCRWRSATLAVFTRLFRVSLLTRAVLTSHTTHAGRWQTLQPTMLITRYVCVFWLRFVAP